MTANSRDPYGSEMEGEIPLDENTPPTGDDDIHTLPEESDAPEAAPTEEQEEELYATPEDEAAYGAAEPPKKRSLFFPLMTVVAVVVVGFIVYTQVKPLLSSSQAPAPLPPLPITPAAPSATLPALTGQPLTPSSPAGSIPAFPQSESSSPAPGSLPLPTTEEEAAKANRPFISGTSEPQPLEAGQPATVVPPEAPVTAPVPTAPLASLPPPVGAAPSPLLQSETAEIASAPVSTPLPTTNASSAQIENRVGQLEQSVAVLTAQQTAMFQMKDTLSQLENQVAKLKASLATQSKTGSAKTAPEKLAPSETQPVQPKQTSAEPTSSPHWDILSASPSQAWVRLEGKNIQRRVVIGDTLVGIGQITSIRKKGNQWVIEGTQGKTSP